MGKTRDLSKKIRNTKGTFHAKMGTIKDRKTCTSASFSQTKALDCVDYNKLWKILQEMEILNYITCILRNLYAS